MAGCSDELEPPVDPGPQPRAEAERTVIVYMAGDNSLGNSAEDNFIPADTTEMLRGKDLIPEDVNFFIYIDDRQQKPAIYELSRKGGIQLWKQYETELNSIDPQTMLSVLREIERCFPARHYGITFWSHATGWAPERLSARRKTFGMDLSQGTPSGKYEMEIPALREVLAQLPKFDYIFFDACFMQCIEVAYELKDVTNFMVGSPAEIPAPGAPYNKIVEALCKGDAEGIVRGYDSGYPTPVYSGVLLSCIDCSKLDALARATGQLLRPIYMSQASLPLQNLQYYCNRTVERYSYCFDMRTTMCRLLSEEDYANWMELFDEAVPLRTHSTPDPYDYYGCPTWNAWWCTPARLKDPTCYGGVSMFIPLDVYDNCSLNEDFQRTSWCAAMGF